MGLLLLWLFLIYLLGVVLSFIGIVDSICPVEILRLYFHFKLSLLLFTITLVEIDQLLLSLRGVVVGHVPGFLRDRHWRDSGCTLIVTLWMLYRLSTIKLHLRGLDLEP